MPEVSDRQIGAKVAPAIAKAMRTEARNIPRNSVAVVLGAAYLAYLSQSDEVRLELTKAYTAQSNDPDGMARLMAQAESGVLLERIRREIAEERELEAGTGPTQLDPSKQSATRPAGTPLIEELNKPNPKPLSVEQPETAEESSKG